MMNGFPRYELGGRVSPSLAWASGGVRRWCPTLIKSIRLFCLRAIGALSSDRHDYTREALLALSLLSQEGEKSAV